ncbi:cell division initiation protein [Paenibacillaceae bacterium]|nr:cell division initiation protein [Paenibacillaceae bacterium]
MSYMHGNLALQPNKRPEEKEIVREKKRVIVRRKTLSVQEKLLYMFTIVACVIIAGTIILKYAQIYQMNLDIREMTSQQDAMAVEMKELQKKVEQLSDPDVIRSKALEAGMVQSDSTITLEVEKASGQTAMAE